MSGTDVRSPEDVSAKITINKKTYFGSTSALPVDETVKLETKKFMDVRDQYPLLRCGMRAIFELRAPISGTGTQMRQLYYNTIHYLDYESQIGAHGPFERPFRPLLPACS